MLMFTASFRHDSTFTERDIMYYDIWHLVSERERDCREFKNFIIARRRVFSVLSLARAGCLFRHKTNISNCHQINIKGFMSERGLRSLTYSEMYDMPRTCRDYSISL